MFFPNEIVFFFHGIGLKIKVFKMGIYSFLICLTLVSLIVCQSDDMISLFVEPFNIVDTHL